MQQAKVCRIVQFFVNKEAEPLAAIITRVFTPTCVNLDVFATNSSYDSPEMQMHPTSVLQRTENGQDNVWDWPERD